MTRTSRMNAAAPIDGEIARDDMMRLFDLMDSYFGDRHWWPADSDEEIVIGAILVQNVAWSNVEVAIERLTQARLLSFDALLSAPPEIIESCITSTLYYRMKAKKLHAFAQHLAVHHQGSLSHLFDQPMDKLRHELLAIYGIGPETADDIILYAARKASFVIDTYTKRILHRIGWIAEDVPYEHLRQWFMTHLSPDQRLFNQFHALLDGVGHRFCRRQNPDCGNCPVAPICNTAQDGQLSRRGRGVDSENRLPAVPNRGGNQ